jgi:hypothetical protein
VSWISRFEKACASFIERAFARGFPSEVSPAHAARKLVSAMEAHSITEDGRIRAPSSYLVYVHPDDFERLASERAYLERQWTELLCDLAARVGAEFTDAKPRVDLLANDRVPSGGVEIEVGGAARKRFGLRVIRGVAAERFYPLEKALCVGRGSDVDVVLGDPSVSRRHAVVELAEDVAVVRDLGSRNGTYVNGERVKAKTLHAGDVLAFGRTELRLENEP